MVKICFVILHYLVIEETIACVESIKRMKNQENIHIVIVDNASPNDSVRILKKRYGHENKIDIIEMDRNEGLSRANNIAYRYVEEKYNPRFYVFTNNDIIFQQEDFLQLVEKEYAHSKFAVMGMDIYSERRKIHQSPLAKEIPNLHAINRTIILNRIAMFLFPLCYPALKKYYEKNQNSGVDADKYDEYKMNVCLMGACIVMEGEFLRHQNTVFHPETYFYYEEYLLALRCKREHALMVYNPEIRVLHTDGASTQGSFTYGRDRIRFQMDCITSAALIYKNEYIKLNSGISKLK